VTLNRRPPHVVSHAAERLADAIVMATNSPADPRTLSAWGQRIGVSRGALRVWCTAARVSARSSLDFLRILRAVIQSQNGAWDLFGVLDIVDERSVVRLLHRGGLVRMLKRTEPPSVDEFLKLQRFVGNIDLVQAVSHRLSQRRNVT
jgi:hypothetical protein